MSISDILNVSLGSFTVGKAISAVITLLICLLAVRTVMKLLSRILAKTSLESNVQGYIVRGAKAVLYLLTAMVVLGDLVDTTSLVALLSVCSLGITLAAEDILGNVAGGLVILSTHPFHIGDYVEADGVGGTVEEISLNHTRLSTANGQYITVPNRALSSTKITNYTALGRRRMNVQLRCAYETPTAAVKAACDDAFAMTPHLLTDPAPVARLTEYGEGAIVYTLYAWAAADDYWGSYFALMENVREAFARHGVKMTYNHLNVHVVEK